MRVLMAGMPNTQNQFARALQKYKGVELIHTNADKGAFDRNADVVVIIRSNINKIKADEIKEYYRAIDKPVLMASMGFSDVKESFERCYEIMKPKSSAMSPAMLEELDDDDGIPEEKEAPSQPARTPIREAIIYSEPELPAENSSPAERRLHLIGRVMGAGLDPAKTMTLIQKIHAGEIDQEETFNVEEYRKPEGTVLQVTRSSIFSDKKSQILELTKAQAMAVLQIKDQIEEFVTSGD